MNSPEQSKCLLLGLLAFQNGFVTREQLFAAFGAWLSDKSKSLSDYLIEQKALKADDLEILLRLVDKHMQSHENDLEKSLAGVKPSTDVLGELQTLAMSHPELEQSLVPLSIPTQKFANPAFEGTRAGAADPAQSRQIGNYRLLQKLGEGGMGTVWMAEQEKPVRRRVALKLIKAGIDNEQIIARFEAERQALSMMDHVNIARVLDAGTTDSGQPYFVMELVQGIPLTEYCDKHRLSLRDRLELFIPVCQAVQHAHQKGIIHRDLKPSNVLVTLYDGKPVPKVIDFGLAKALQHQTKLTDKTMFTEFGQVVGTLQYMSPEQAEMNAFDIDTRSDIYSLGVMLYELLTGSTPIEKEAMRNEAILKVLQTIREVEPQRPSARLSSTTQEAVSGISQQRRIDPRKLQSILRGELDWIVMKSLEKDRARRYSTAVDLAEDIERHLSGDPIRARPPSVGYKLRKFVRKNRGLVALTVLASSFLGAAIVGTSWFTVEYRKMRQGQIVTLVDALQNNRGPSVHDNLRILNDTLPDNSVLPELQRRFTSATNPRHKLSLAFALANYGQLDADYLVSRIDDDDISESESTNYVTALKTNVRAAIESIKSESAKCVDKSLWRRKAKLAITALNIGDTTLANDVCAIGDRPDPEQRTLFIDEFPRWENQLKDIHDLVASSDSPALRSGICLAVGQIAVDKLSDADKERWQSLASRWFVEKGDTTTHSAAGWLLRQWRIAEPRVPESDKIIEHRDWFVNSVGATMLKMHSGATATVDLVDPLESFRKQLSAMSQLTASELDNPEARQTRAIAYFQVGNIDSALEDLDWLIAQNQGSDSSKKSGRKTHKYRTLALARLGKAEEAKASLATYLAKEDLRVSGEFYVSIQLPAWLGDYAEATRRLESAIVDPSKTKNDQYNVACAASLCSKAAFAKSPVQSKQFADRAVEILGKLIREGYDEKHQLKEDPDFANLHDDKLFASLLMEIDRIPEYWVADREVSRGQFELFMSDALHPEKEKPEKWEGADKVICPTLYHPVQQVSWNDSVMFCNWLSFREGRMPCYERTGSKVKSVGTLEYDAWRLIPGSNGYRLLREAEWEYACRAGTETEYSMGNDVKILVSYCQMYPSRIASPCGSKLPNGWGIHDLHGNVSEWCEELYDGRFMRVFRGGGWGIVAADCRSAYRGFWGQSGRGRVIGFRLALSPSTSSP